VTTDDNSHILAITGQGGGAVVGVGGVASYNQIHNTVKSYIDSATATTTATAGSLFVRHMNTPPSTPSASAATAVLSASPAS